jgi:hypothetical protein
MEPPKGSGERNEEGNHDGIMGKDDKRSQGMHGVAMGRGGGWRSTIADALDITPDTSNDNRRAGDEQKDNGNKGATMRDQDTQDKDEEMEGK